MIFEPLSNNDTMMTMPTSKNFETLESKQFDTLYTFEMLLADLQTMHKEYIISMRSMLHKSTLFLKRKPSEIYNNSFCKQMPKLWRANTDAQFVLNAYATTMYCSSYMEKVDRSMTHAFKRIRDDHQRENIDAIGMIRKLGNILLNLQQMSAQQVAH